ncbi:relaxase/mobilization nuclease domain-containing protein [Lachnospiraceae bacterium OttesenSCG-928-D06]|nr:relaxase/mobilization nuclease domain-containing protein [Lachnospiraceae bacterium OttesenSCG-928-D06]
MAYTKIHAIKATVNKAIDYICNPDKTDEQLLISSFACSPETAAIDFKYILAHTNQHDENKAYHLIQSFLPGEVTFDEAHRIGQELADRTLEGKYSYVVSTHIDKGHVHNHIIFCAADNIEHNKYHDCKQTYYRVRKLSDELCVEHNLSIIKPGAERGKSYTEWQANQSDTSWKTQMRRDINISIKSSSTYEEFLLLMRAKGYEIKGESFGEGAAKYITFRPLDKDRPVRGSVKSLGKEYTKERIRERIEAKALQRISLPKKDYSSKQLIDTSTAKFQESKGLKQWATIENLKIAASAYNDVNSIAELKHQITVKTEIGKNARESLVKVEHRMKDLAEIIKYAEQYTANRPYNTRYKKAKDPDSYFRKNESKIILYGGAKRMLLKAGIDLKALNINKLRQEYDELSATKVQLSSTLKSSEKEAKELNLKLNNLSQYLGLESENNTIATSAQQKRNDTTL